MPRPTEPSPTQRQIDQHRSQARRGHPDNHAAIRQLVLEAAMRMAEPDGGIGAVSMRSLATAVGLSPMGLYRYFASKADLLEAMWEVVVGEALLHTRRFVQRGSTARERLELSIDGYLDYWEQHPSHFRLAYMTPELLDPGSRAALTRNDAYQAAMRLAPQLIADFIAEVGGLPERAAVARDLRFALMSGYLHAHIANRRFPWGDRAELRRHTVRAIMRSIEDCVTHP